MIGGKKSHKFYHFGVPFFGQSNVTKRAINCKAFADDTTLITHSTDGANALLKDVESFCDYSGMQVRPDKCEVTGRDFGDRLNPEMDVSGVMYKGQALKVLPSANPTKYLGTHISLTLSWKAEKAYVVGKMKAAVAQLRNTCYTR